MTVLKSFAKVNLTLSVTKKLENGFHDIQSIYCLINLFDKISIKKIKKKRRDKIIFYGPFSRHVGRRNNSISRGLQLLRKYKIISSYYLIKINKKIPVFAGFGGGSSNVATVLKYLIKKKIKKKILDKIYDQLDTDLRLFFTIKATKKILKQL